jgi:hypothetical protein
VRFDVVLWADNDSAGRAHMQAHQVALIRLGCKSVRRIEWREAPPKGDAADFTGDDAALQALIDSAAKETGTDLIIAEEVADAVVANEAYLARPEIVERLLYGQSSSLVVGGKHHGKTTLVRSLALCVSRGIPFLAVGPHEAM